MSTQEHHLQIAAADGAPGFEVLAKDIIQEFGNYTHVLEPVVVDDDNTDWDHLYPFSAVRSCSSGRVILFTFVISSFSKLIKCLWSSSQITSAHGLRNKFLE